MPRTALATLAALLISTGPVFAAAAPPSILETLEYLKDRVNGAASSEVTSPLTANVQKPAQNAKPGELFFNQNPVEEVVVGVKKKVTNYHLRTHIVGDPNDKKLKDIKGIETLKEGSYLLVVESTTLSDWKRTVPVSKDEIGLNTPKYVPDGQQVVELSALDLEAVTVQKAAADTPYFVVVLKPLDTKKPSVTFCTSNERTAHVAARAIRHVLRELHGRPAVKQSTVDFFEGGLPAPAVVAAPTPTPAVRPPAEAAPPEVPKPANNAERVAARKRVEQALIDAEGELVQATKLDADNKAANDAKRAALRKQLDGLNADARKARADGQSGKAAVAVAAGLVVLADINDEFKWAKDTSAAARVQNRITLLRKQLVDLRD